ncbi:MAG: hypothetical protein GXP29_15605 [Planctomycetes bacterium]|nr:hypothetical protein [Planctomycetota bacterium]
MKTFDVEDSQSRLIAFEIENAGIGRRGVCALISSIPNTEVTRSPKLLSWFREDAFCEFVVDGEPYIVEEPFGDNSRYWIGPKSPRWLPQTEGLRDAVAQHPESQLLRWLGFAVGVAFVFVGILMLNGGSIGERASLLATISLIGTGAYFINYALTGRSTFWHRRRTGQETQEPTMTTFETDGFLSDEMPNLEAQAEERYGEKLELARDANRAAHGLIYSIQIHNEHLPDILLATLLARQSSSFQSFCLLIKKGLFFQSQILLRNIAEHC